MASLYNQKYQSSHTICTSTSDVKQITTQVLSPRRSVRSSIEDFARYLEPLSKIPTQEAAHAKRGFGRGAQAHGWGSRMSRVGALNRDVDGESVTQHEDRLLSRGQHQHQILGSLDMN